MPSERLGFRVRVTVRVRVGVRVRVRVRVGVRVGVGVGVGMDAFGEGAPRERRAQEEDVGGDARVDDVPPQLVHAVTRLVRGRMVRVRVGVGVGVGVRVRVWVRVWVRVRVGVRVRCGLAPCRGTLPYGVTPQ